jgi:cob(I)alamin adenosyltransferase
MPKQPRKSNLYTRAGDAGETSLFGGKRVAKDHPRVVAYGTIDELNSVLGVAISFIRQRPLVASLHKIQNELFNIGAELASDKPVRRRKKRSGTFELASSSTIYLEQLIDEYDAKVPPLKTFVLPSGSNAGAFMHLARTVCRRAERNVVTLGRKEEINPEVLAYLNRLNDLLFALARYLNKAARRRELLWTQDS